MIAPPASSRARDARPACASRDRVDVWQVVLTPVPAAGAALLALLDPAERAHAARLRVGAARWVAARAALRGVIGHYLGMAPARVPLERDARGKPRVATAAAGGVRFNLSRSGDLALVAVRLDREVGVDLERVRDGVDGGALARELLPPPARPSLVALAAEGPRAAFFRAWARHEALVKAAGGGLTGPPDRYPPAHFSVRALGGIPGYAAAIASEGADWGIARIVVSAAPGLPAASA